MKTLKLTLSVIFITLLICGIDIKAQTFQKEMRSSFTDIMAYCLNRSVDGEFVYHFTYHLDRETGKIDRVHYNVAKSEVRDHITQEKYILHDIGNDNIGLGWDFWNNINNYTDNQWPVVNGWLPLPEDLPVEGRFIGMNFKFIGKGGVKFSMKYGYIIHMNSNGEITVEKVMEYVDCNE